MPPEYKLIRTVVGVAGAVAGVMALATAALALIANAKPAWFLFAFEVILPVPAVLAVFFATRRVKDPTGLGVGCIAGTILLASVLGFLSIPEGLLGVDGGPVGVISLRLWLAVRGLLALVIGACAVKIALGSDRRRWMVFFKGLAFGAMAVAILAVSYKFRGSFLVAQKETMVEALRVLGVLVASVASLVGICAGVQFTIQAFEPAEDSRAPSQAGADATPGVQASVPS